MRAPLLSFILLLAAVATVPLVSAVSKGEEAGAASEENGGSIKPLSLDRNGPLEKAAKKPMEQNLDAEATPKMIPVTFDQKPIEEQAEKAVASTIDDQDDKYVASLVPDEKAKEEAPAKVKNEKSDESADESVYHKKEKKAKKEKKEKSDYLDDESTSSSKKEKKEKSDDSDLSTSSKKKKKKVKTDDSNEDASLDKKEKKEKSDESADESVYHKKEKKAKKEKKEKSDYLDDESTSSSKKEKKEKSDDSDLSTSSKKKKKKVKTDDSNEDASLDKKEKKEKFVDFDVSTSSKKKEKAKTDDSDEDPSLDKKEKKEKSASVKKHKKDKSDDDSDSTSPKKQKNEKSIDLDASDAYLQKEEKKSGDSSDEATSLKKQKKEKKKKKKQEKSEENADEDAAPVDVSTDGKYVSSPKEEKSGEDAMPADVSTTTGQYVSSSKTGSKAKADAYASPKQDTSTQPMAGGSPDELPPATKSSGTPDPYLSSKQQVLSSQPMPMAGGSPDELPAQAKSSSGTPADPYASLNVPPSPGTKPKLSMETFSGMIKRPIAKFLSPVIKGVCAKTEYPEDCEASIGALPGAASAAATDSVGVLKLAMEAVREKVIVAMNAATDRMNVPGTDPTTKDALDSCTSSYSDIKTSLDSVDDALKRGDVDTAHTNLDAVETDITTCDDGFQEHGIPSVMTDHDQELQKLASNLLSIGAAIHH